MRRVRIGMRWWLAIAFAAVAALTAFAVVSVLSARSERGFRAYAENFAVGDSVTAAERLKRDSDLGALRSDVVQLAARRKIALFVFDGSGKMLTSALSHGTSWSSVPHHATALRAALSKNRFIGGSRDGSAIVVGVLIHGGAGSALVAYSSRPELHTQLGIVRNEFFLSALIAIAIGATVGLAIATLTSRRLARIAKTARALGAGDFTATVEDRFPDEVGSLAGSIEQMRARLSGLFEALHQDRNRLEQLLDRLDEAVVVLDSELTVEFANGRARELFTGPTLDQPGLIPFGPEGERALQEFAGGLFSGAEPSHLRLTAADGRTFLVSGVPPGPGSPTAIIVLFDESQRERSERAQREFATNAAHELRTPLASIVTAIEMLQTGAKDDPDVRDEFLELIAKESDRLTRLTRALLVLARAEAREEAPQVGAVAIKPILEEVAAGLSHAPDVVVRVECADDVVALGDPDLLEQALTNLAANALQHTSAGVVVLRASHDVIAVTIEVADDGAGMALETAARAFDRFYRAGQGDRGFGIGLAIARESVRALGGDVEIHSTPGSGTTVRITVAAAARGRDA